MYRLLFIFTLFFALTAKVTRASHNRAGEITFKWLQGFEYEITITTYTVTSSIQADRPYLDSVHFGDGTQARFDRVNGPYDAITGTYTGEPLAGDIKYNVYKRNHSYPGAGTYKIYFVDPNRNDGVINVPNSFYTPFSVYTILKIDPAISPPNNSPVLLNPPIDSGCVGVPFIYNPAAYDPDPGDRLTYELTVCRGDGGDPIAGYTFPQTSNILRIDTFSGELLWDSPVAQAPAPPWEYNIAFVVKEWRFISGAWRVIGEIERDMQIRILNCPPNLHSPSILNINDTCVLAGDSLAFNVTAYDQDGDLVLLSSVGGPYVISDPAIFIPPANNGANDTVTGTFSWNTTCTHVRQLPYQVTFRAQDTLNPTISLVTYRSVLINVIAPPVTGLAVTPNANTMLLHWNPHQCPQVSYYRIYHRNGSYPGNIPCPCETGAPSYTGYALIGTAPGGVNDTTFMDDNNGQGLPIGISHCYIVTAVFSDGSESCASEQVCNQLKKDLPVITHVTIGVTGAGNGVDTVMWSKATEIDTIAFPRPYQYRIYRSNDFFGNSFGTSLATLPENDTDFVDPGLNTTADEHSYKIELYYDSDNDGVADSLKGSTQIASSVFLTLNPTDERIILSWEEHVPWSNYRYDIFKRNAAFTYDSIGTTTNTTYIDSNLVNDSTYCYYVRSVGSYATSGIVDPIFNLSQRVCAEPVDNVPPCAPQLTVTSFCLDEQNFLQWTNPNNTCADDVVVYYIYYAPDSSFSFEVVDSVSVPTDTTFIHEDIPSLAGCYRVTAIDSSGNESAANTFCVDTCRQYVLPSVFTPNGDNQNDLFHPCDSTTSFELQRKNCPSYKNVKDIDLKIYNRWGTLVFETTDRDINWDGKNKDSKGDCPDGVYYYTCLVNFYRLNGTESRNLHGYVHLIRGK